MYYFTEATEETQNTTSSTRNHEAARRTQNTTLISCVVHKNVCQNNNRFPHRSFFVLNLHSKSHSMAMSKTLSDVLLFLIVGDFYFDKGFCIMVDGVCIAKTSCALNAFIILLNAFFVFDLQYPSSMTLTFEFVER